MLSRSSHGSLTALLALLLVSDAVTALDCVWLYSAYQGIPLTSTLSTRWNCSGTLGISAVSPVLDGFSIPNVRVPTFTYTPPLVDSVLGQQSQSLTITCNVFTKGCDSATVYFVVRPSGLTTPTPPTTTPAPPTTTTTTTTTVAPTPVPTLAPGETAAPTTAAPTTTTTPAPTTPAPTPTVPVVCTTPTTVITSIATATTVPVMSFVSGSSSPALQLADNSSSLFTIASDGVTVTFDANATNTAQGVYTAVFDVTCGSALVCILTQYVVAAAPAATTTLAPPTPSPSLYTSCTPVYGYECFFGTIMNLSLTGLDGASVCPTGTNSSTFQLLSTPRVNVANFTFDYQTGNFVYIAPSVVTVDGFSFNIVCDQVVLCSATAYLITTSSASETTQAPTTMVPSTSPAPSTTPIPTTAPMPSCVGSFSYVFYRDAAGTFDPQEGNLYTSLSQNFSTSCNTFSGISIVRNAFYGLVTIVDSANGIFQYAVTAGTAGPTDWDNFTATISCAAPVAQECLATVSILVLSPSNGSTPAPTPVPTLSPPVYHISNVLTCQGTCSADAWKSIDTWKSGFDITPYPNGSYPTGRADGRALNDVEFFLGSESTLYFVAFTKIGNMAARFPTFVPVESSGLLTSAAATGTGAAFDPSCLDEQGKYGVAYALWNWTNSNLTSLQGVASGNYASRKDYYQRFGGKHNDCDTFRNSACEYAPLLNPGNGTGITWRLLVEDCDATWIGSAPLSVIRALRFTNGSSIFTLQEDGKTLQGTLYSEVIKPASWVRPSQGTLELMTPYTVKLYIRNLLTMNVSTTLYTPATTSTATVNASSNTSTTAVPPTTTTAAPTTTTTPTMVISGNASSNTSSNASSYVNVTTSAPAANATTPTPAPAAPLYTAELDFAIDVSYSISEDPVTRERLYDYNIMLYPANYTTLTNTSYTIFDELYVVGVRLGSASFVTPHLSNCLQCTGNLTSCVGVNNSFNDSCGSAAMVSFTPFTGVYPSPCSNASTFPAVPGVSNASYCPQEFFNVSFVGRVNGANSSLTAGQPEGDISILVSFSNGQTVQAFIHQERYITQASTTPLPASLCRGSYYWPVVDPVGTSVSTSMYTVPTAVAVGDTFQTIDFRNATVPTSSNASLQTSSAALCEFSDERVFGPTAWAYFSINISQLPTATVDFLALLVDASEVVPNPAVAFPSNGRFGGQQSPTLIILLEGNGTAARGSVPTLLEWQLQASFLQFRKIDSGSSDLISYAFVPGTLLRSGSSKSVLIELLASLKLPSGSSTLVRYIIPVSTSFNAAVRGEAVLTAYPSYNTSSTAATSTMSKSKLVGFAFGLVMVVIVFIAALIAKNAETRQAFLSESAALIGCLTCRREPADSTNAGGALGDETVVVPITKTQTTTTMGPNTTTVTEPSESPRVRKALTPAAAAAQAAKQQRREAVSSPASSPTTATPATATALNRATSAPLVPIESEPARVSHDE
mmetsp:Transcript_41650/g.48281  ORF Transcript_41650/g.48281 Transcript_41650/m.48281 type:complete len:1469 (-) Transcript_41650:468-4874(-)